MYKYTRNSVVLRWSSTGRLQYLCAMCIKENRRHAFNVRSRIYSPDYLYCLLYTTRPPLVCPLLIYLLLYVLKKDSNRSSRGEVFVLKSFHLFILVVEYEEAPHPHNRATRRFYLIFWPHSGEKTSFRLRPVRVHTLLCLLVARTCNALNGGCTTAT